MPRFCLFVFLFTSALHAAAPINFSREIRPILSENCFTCHGPDDKKREAELRFDDEASAKKMTDGVAAIVPGHPEKSTLLDRIASTDPDEVMPPPKMHKKVTPQQVVLLTEWIKQGAKWGKHWSYEKVVRPAVPKSASLNPIDVFLLARLQKEKLLPSPAADPATLIRRATLDLTGLPPTPAEVNAFVAACSPAEDLKSQITDFKSRAWSALIERLLARPAYGEHWAREWLDLARYADSAGYPSDPGREIWAYRDWVVRALNSNMPFDEFTIEQLAGDLLPSPSDDQLTATAFHRNTMTQNEGGTSDEEFRNAAIIDRVNTTMAVWMGTTMACAQCHTHKYDPITISEYFQFYAFLNQSADADKRDESPLHELWQPGQKEHLAKLKAEAAAASAVFANPDPQWLAGLEKWASAKHPELDALKPKPSAVIAALAVPLANRKPAQTQEIQDYYLRNVAPETKAQRDKLSALTKQVDAVKPLTVPIMADLEAKARRKTNIQLRGNWQALGDEVNEGTPAVFPALPAGAVRNRLTLAQWIVSRDNPLTARVTVNRLWESIFGYGIVRSSEEFGSQGDLPFHPELLDWLAAELMDSGWDMKHMLKLMLTTQAYRQDSHSSAAMNERDPDNRLLARGPRFRPTGELLRDQALAVSGLLSPKLYGKPVRPLRPSLGLSTAFGGSQDWVTSEGTEKHRRSLYTEIKRNSPYPSFSTFDAPNREVCNIRRGRTNTPLQAFVTLNDPVFIEANQALARRIVSEGAGDIASRLSFVFKLCLSREPSAKEAAALTKLHHEALASYKTDAASATAMATDPLGPAPKGADIAELAAWTTVANVVMNLDEFVMRR